MRFGFCLVRWPIGFFYLKTAAGWLGFEGRGVEEDVENDAMVVPGTMRGNLPVEGAVVYSAEQMVRSGQELLMASPSASHRVTVPSF